MLIICSLSFLFKFNDSLLYDLAIILDKFKSKKLFGYSHPCLHACVLATQQEQQQEEEKHLFFILIYFTLHALETTAIYLIILMRNCIV